MTAEQGHSLPSTALLGSSPEAEERCSATSPKGEAGLSPQVVLGNIIALWVYLYQSGAPGDFQPCPVLGILSPQQLRVGL